MMAYIGKKAVLWLALLGAITAPLFVVEVQDRVSGTFEALPIQRREVAAPLAGFVSSVYVHEGDRVESGAVIARLEIPELNSQIAQARARVEEARAELMLLESGARQEEVSGQRHRVERTRAWRDVAQQKLAQGGEALQHELDSLTHLTAQHRALANYKEEELGRAAKLKSSGAISDEEYLRAKAEYEELIAKWQEAQAVRRARHALGTVEAQTDLARIGRELADADAILALMEAGSRKEEIDAARAVLEQFEAELGYLLQCQNNLEIVSPAAGILVTPRLEEKIGQFLEIGDPICEVSETSELKFQIAVDEASADRVGLGQIIELKARALPFDVIRATVEQIAPVAHAELTGQGDTPMDKLQPQHRIGAPSKILIHCSPAETASKLRPGMTGHARIYTARRTIGEVLLDRTLRFVRTEFWW